MSLKSSYQEYSDSAKHIWEKMIPIAWLRETIETIVWAVVLALILRAFVIQAFWIPSGSMIPTLLAGDRVLVCKFWYYIRKPQRGDIFVFIHPEKEPDKPKVDYVKRLIALPGDTFEIRTGKVYINNAPVDEPYVKFHDTYTLAPIKVPAKSYIALGDNRPNSSDSRFWGYVPEQNIKGPVFFRYWPLTRIGPVE